ncbi:MAG: SCO family protein, partial [Chloroflexota bacterium]
MSFARTSLAVMVAIALHLMAVGPLWAHSLTAKDLEGVGFEPHPGDRVSGNLTFHDESGQSVRLGDYLGQRPVVLTLNYFSCPNLCPLTVQDLASALGDVPFALGDQFTVLTVSIDPTDTPKLASEKK